MFLYPFMVQLFTYFWVKCLFSSPACFYKTVWLIIRYDKRKKPFLKKSWNQAIMKSLLLFSLVLGVSAYFSWNHCFSSVLSVLAYVLYGNDLILLLFSVGAWCISLFITCGWYSSKAFLYAIPPVLGSHTFGSGCSYCPNGNNWKGGLDEVSDLFTLQEGKRIFLLVICADFKVIMFQTITIDFMILFLEKKSQYVLKVWN